MRGLIIFAAVILLLALLLNVKLRAEIKFYGGKLDLKVKYLWITLFPLKKREKKQRRRSKPHKNEDESKQESEPLEEPYTVSKAEVEEARRKKAEADEPADVPKKEKLTDKVERLTDLIEKVKIVWNASCKPLLRIFKRIYIDGLVIDFVIAEGDAYDTAMRYGTVNAAVYNALNVLRLLFSTDIKSVDIACDFDGKASVYDGEVKICLRPATVLSAVFSILFGLLLNLRKLIGKSRTKGEKAVTA